MITYTDTAKAVWQAGLQKQLTLALSSGVTLTNSDILIESMSLKQSCNENEQFTIGNVYSSEFNVTIFNDAPASDYVGLTLTPTLTAVDEEDNEYPQQLGVFTVESAKRTSDRIYRELVCYDLLSPILQTDYSAWYNALQFPMTVKLLRDAFFAFIGIQQETIVLPNDNVSVELKYPFDTLSGADLLHAICEVNGAWGFLNYTGKFQYVIPKAVTSSILYPAETLYPSTVLYPGGRITTASGTDAYGVGKRYVQGSLAFEEFKTAPITAVTVKQTTGEIEVTSGTSGNTLTLTDNILLYFVGETVMQTVASNILANIEGFQYVPVSVQTAPTPWVELGDWVSFDVDDDVIYCPVMQRTLSGITAVKDTFTATGTEEIQENANSMENRIASVEATARGTGNYFWVDDDGAHVTQVPKSDIVADGWTGIYNSLVTSTDFQVRYGETPLATFGEEVTIGNDEDSALHLTSDSITGAGAAGKVFFDFKGDGATQAVVYNVAKYLTKRSGVAAIDATVVGERFDANTDHGYANITVKAKDGSSFLNVSFSSVITYGSSVEESQTRTVDGVEYEFLLTHATNSNRVSFTVIPDGLKTSHNVAGYFSYSNNESTPTYVLGAESDVSGAYSSAIGYGNTVSGEYSNAFGYGLNVEYEYQTALGKYNESRPGAVLEVGHGTAQNPKSVFSVMYNGWVFSNSDRIVPIKSVTISGTTSTSANVSTGITISTGVVVGFQSDASNSYAFIPFCRSDGTWYLHVMQANASQAALASTAVSGTVYYLAF